MEKKKELVKIIWLFNVIEHWTTISDKNHLLNEFIIDQCQAMQFPLNNSNNNNIIVIYGDSLLLVQKKERLLYKS